MNIMAMLRAPKGCLGCLGLVVVIIALFVGGLMLGGIMNPDYKLPAISLAAEEIPLPFELPFFGDSVPNTLPATWLTMLILIVVSFFATRSMKEVPSGLQNVVEAIVEMFYGFIENVAGTHYAPLFFPLVATFFFFIGTSWGDCLGPLLPLGQRSSKHHRCAGHCLCKRHPVFRS
jgi:hypothetical protein